jgi:hypothetical protein
MLTRMQKLEKRFVQFVALNLDQNFKDALQLFVKRFMGSSPEAQRGVIH